MMTSIERTEEDDDNDTGEKDEPGRRNRVGITSMKTMVLSLFVMLPIDYVGDRW
jgi:hypothetical protein